jgi:hypothetical protein
MLFLFWLIVRTLTRLLVLQGPGDGAKDLKILVLRQQLRVLRRQAGRPTRVPQLGSGIVRGSGR